MSKYSKLDMMKASEVIGGIMIYMKSGNPYPKDIFIEPTKEEYKRMRKAFQTANLVPDKFFGSFGRKVWENCTNSFDKYLRDE